MNVDLVCPVCGAHATSCEMIVKSGEPRPLFAGVPVEEAFIQGPAELMDRVLSPCGHSVAEVGWTAEGGWSATQVRREP